MTSRERILRAMRARPVDQVATAPRMWKFNRTYYGRHDPETSLRSAAEFGYDPLYYTSVSVPSFFGPSIASAEALPEGVTCTGEVDEGENFDIIRRRFETPAGAVSDVWHRPHADRGYGISPAPIPIETLLKGPEDLEALKCLTSAPSPGAIRSFAGLTDFFGEQGLVSPYVRSPFNDLSYLYPVVDALMLAYDAPDFLRDLLAFLQEACLADIRAHLEAGASTIFISGFHISLSVGWSPAIFREFFLPLIKEQAAVTHDGGAVFHYYDDGKMMAILDMLIEAEVDVASTCTPAPAGDFDLRAAKEQVGDRLVLMGYVDIESVLHRGTAELVEETVREAIEIGAADDAFVLSTSDGVLTQTPVENMRAYFAAAKKYGRRGQH